MLFRSRRPFDAVRDEAACVYGHLSPENLSCDGECSRAQVEVKRGQLHRALRALFIEAGREITESEAFGLTPYQGEKCPVSYHAQAAANAPILVKPGDKVSFPAPRGRTITGIVKQVNLKSVTVTPLEGFGRWRVSPSLIQKEV